MKKLTRLTQASYLTHRLCTFILFTLIYCIMSVMTAFWAIHTTQTCKLLCTHTFKTCCEWLSIIVKDNEESRWVEHFCGVRSFTGWPSRNEDLETKYYEKPIARRPSFEFVWGCVGKGHNSPEFPMRRLLLKKGILCIKFIKILTFGDHHLKKMRL